MKKILYVYHASNIGGGTYCLLNILKELNRELYEPIVLLRNDGSLVNEIRKLGIEVLFFPGLSQYPYNKSLFKPKEFIKLFKIWKSKDSFKKLLRGLDVDAVYLNTIVLTPYLKVCKQLGLKTIIHIREHWPIGEHKYQFRYLCNHITQYADQIVAINSYSASLLRGRDVSIVYDWIDFSERYEYRPFDRIFGEKTECLKVYLYTGGNQKIKGFYQVMKAFHEYVNDNKSRLLVVGIPPLSKSSGIKGVVKTLLYCLGYQKSLLRAYDIIKHDSRIVQIPSTYKMKHIFQQSYCNLSYFTIPHANLALAECIILNSICVAAKNEESLEYSDDGKLAVLFDPYNFNDFIAAIRQVDSNYYALKQKLENSKKIELLFDKESNVKKLEGVYSKLFFHN